MRTFIDCLNILEKHYILENASDWDKLKIIRNRLTHEYPNNIDEQIYILNEVYDSYNALLIIFNNIQNCFDSIKK